MAIMRASSAEVDQAVQATKTATPFQTEAWTEYGLGVVIIFLRIFARWRVVGFKKWQGDDYFTIIALIFWTAELTMLELIGQNGTNIGLSPETRASLTPDQIKRLEIGSKCLIAGWICYSTLIWSLKACMLFFYNRITLGLNQQKLVKANAVLCVFTYLAVVITVLTHCRPLHKHWQVNPDPGDECTIDVVNYIVIVVTNLTTDGILVCIPLPLLLKVRLSIGRKLAIGVLLCGGIFVMVATLLRCILSLKDASGINNSTIWAIRETFVGLIAVHAPCIKPLFSTSVWLKSSKGDSSKDKYGNTGGSVSYGMSVFGKSNTQNNVPATKLTENGSEEMILRDNPQNSPPGDLGFWNDVTTSADGGLDGPKGIQVTTTYEVTQVEESRANHHMSISSNR